MNEALAQVTFRKCLTQSALDEDRLQKVHYNHRCSDGEEEEEGKEEEEDSPDTDVVV